MACTVGLSGCYASTDYGRYPDNVDIRRKGVAREWISNGVSISFGVDGSFSANDLTLEYFECPLEGVSAKSGEGTWDMFKRGSGSEIIVRFDDGCSGTLWAGERDKEVVLWGSYSDRDDVLILE